MNSNYARSGKSASDDHGMALLAVLWVVAALSIMLSGMLQVVRTEAGIAGQFRQTVINQGVADAAIRMTLRELELEKGKPIKAIQTKTISVFDQEVKIEVIPMNGAIDLNNAPESLLADAFEYGAGVSRETAQRLANSAIEARDRKNAQGVPVRFHANEELLRLDGVNYDIYARLKNVFTVDTAGSGRVNPLASSMPTLVILAKGDLARAKQLFELRLSNPESMDTTTLTAPHIDMASTSYLAIRATLPNQDHRFFTRTWRVDVATAAYGLPWRLLGEEQNTMIEPSTAK